MGVYRGLGFRVYWSLGLRGFGLRLQSVKAPPKA